MQFEDKPYFTDEQIDGYLENIENVLKELGVVWSDYDYDEELLEDGDEEFYTLAQNVFEKIYFKSFRVADGFPRLIPGKMPDGIIKASYDIDLNKLNDFENR